MKDIQAIIEKLQAKLKASESLLDYEKCVYMLTQAIHNRHCMEMDLARLKLDKSHRKQ